MYDLNKYISDDGLMSLSDNSFSDSYSDKFKNTCDNDNGILFLTEFVLLNGTYQKENYFRALNNTKCGYGLYHRNPGRDDYINSHDNFTAMAAGCIFYNDTEVFKEVCAILPVINNKNPGQLNIENMHRPSGIHFPHFWFIYKLAAGFEPGWILTLLFCSALLFECFKEPSLSTKWITWLCVESAKRVTFIEGKKLSIINQCINQWEKQGHMKHANGYFNPDHPIYNECLKKFV